jgi:hypothetical protein
MQKWAPNPKATWQLGSRPLSNGSAVGTKTVSSRLAEVETIARDHLIPSVEAMAESGVTGIAKRRPTTARRD